MSRFLNESEISPGSRHSFTNLYPLQSAVAPWEDTDAHGAVKSGRWNAQPVQASWPTGGAMPATAFGEYLRHDSDNEDPIQARSIVAARDDRRPSAASGMTASSKGSNGSQNQNHSSQKKFQGGFREDSYSVDSRQQSVTTFPLMGSDVDDVAQSGRPSFLRGRSFFNDSNKQSRPVSPTEFRPKTPPQVSSEVTPWLFQDHKVSC